MRAVFGLVLIVGLGLAGFAVYMVQGYFEQQQQALARERAAAREQTPTVEIYAVTRDIGYGEELTPADVAVIRYAQPHLPAGTFATEEELFPQGAANPRTVLRRMEANEPVLASKVTGPGERAGITTRLTPGMRAFTVSVDATSGVSGFLRPGDRVDVYWTGQMPGSNTGEVTKLIDTALEIIAVDQSSDADRTEASVADTVTVQVSPQQVAHLAQAQATGSLSLSLVGLQDETIAAAIEVDQRALLGIVEQAPIVEEVEEAPEVCTTRVRRGADVVDIQIPCATN
ncbi:Flp pilus assembly protein CpaB [Wenxinia marina]|uniref:Flp pilus assembly protein CpaB n=1 Tax=Wenxinia marina DSM 24838 TaxID=1123501 RepID=A0A0D0NI06_9RHOB|nr:Flp pilus assembly protein CpaB [Wenxinia marina]KIQ67970.1 Flp pilus assembly protein CpaB [Wenxinia marina DSM 24838]GGL75815.1 Flp pilus assembly protein CpaB [Wenxinia marina]